MINGRIFAVAVAALAAGCGAPASDPDVDGSWVGTVTTEGDVTTVVTRSGSVWGEVEIREALSIGVAAGDDPYMFGGVRTLAVDEQRIYAIDVQISTVRVYDKRGVHLLDIGREGVGGPGELERPWTMGVGPTGRVFVQDLWRVTVFEPEGTFVETWPYRGGGRVMTVGDDGTVWVPATWTENDRREVGHAVLSADGVEIGKLPAEPFDRAAWELRASNGREAISTIVPYSTGTEVAPLPGGEIARGDSSEYRIELERPDGTILAIERRGELPPVPDEKREWLVDHWSYRLREYESGWTWTARAIPERVPAFDAIFGDRHGRVWLRRIVGIERDPGCDPMAGGPGSRSGFACWRDVMAFDVFDAQTGRYLGQVPIPEEATGLQRPAFDRDVVYLVVEDEAGTIMVKGYELVRETPAGEA